MPSWTKDFQKSSALNGKISFRNEKMGVHANIKYTKKYTIEIISDYCMPNVNNTSYIEHDELYEQLGTRLSGSDMHDTYRDIIVKEC